MSVESALKFADQYFSSQISLRVCFPFALLAWFLQMLTLGTQDWVQTQNSTIGLWKYCNYSNSDFTCCQNIESFLAKSYSIPRVPAWLSASRVFEIFGLVTSLGFIIACLVYVASLDVKARKRVKKCGCALCIITVIFIVSGGFIFFGEYSETKWMDTATLSFSFGICMASALFHILCFLFFIITNDDFVQSLDVDEQWQGPLNEYGTEEFWNEILVHPTTPMYWIRFKGGYRVTRYLNEKNKCEIVGVSQEEFNAVEKLINCTSVPEHVGLGADANDIKYNCLVVKKVQRIENVELWYNYIHERGKIIRKLLRDKDFNKLDEISAKGSIQTMRCKDNILRRELYPDLNECFLFHGTKPNSVDNIATKGMDPRHAGKNPMMGRGNYCAESSTKSDQYADDYDNRQNRGLKMFLVRMLLGKMYVAKKKKKYKLPPCTAYCTDECKDKSHEHFDSVIADIPGMNFREFIVYDRNQCYPEYIITYDRK